MKAEADRASDNWRPKRAWLFLLTIVVVNLVLSTVLLGLRGGVRQAEFLTPNELGLIGLFGNSINLVICLIFSRVQSFGDFRDSFRFVAVSGKQMVVAAIAGFLIQTVAILFFEGSLMQMRFRPSFDLLVVAALCAPFLEEPVFRGFVYGAFRKHLPAAVSIGLVAGVATLLHGSRALGSFQAITAIGTANVACCILREKMGSLWPSIVCHLAFNAIPAATE
jgi:membrane protease YdiL (CAAX protease family)